LRDGMSSSDINLTPNFVKIDPLFQKFKAVGHTQTAWQSTFFPFKEGK